MYKLYTSTFILRLVLILLCYFQCFHTRAQKVNFTYQKGLSAPVKKIISIPGSNVCIISDKTGGVIAWNRNTNKILCRVQSISDELNDLVYIGQEQMIVAAGNHGFDLLDAKQLLTTEKLMQYTIPDKANSIMTALCWNENKKLLYALRSNGEVSTYQSVADLKSGKVFGSFISGISGSFAIQCLNENICILGINRQGMFDSKGNKLFSIDSYSTLMYAYAFAERDSAVYVPRNGDIIELSYRQNRFKERLIPLVNPGKEKLVTALLVTNRGELLAGTNDDQLFLLNPVSAQILKTYKQDQTSFTSICLFNDQLLLGDFFGNISVLHPESLKLEYQLNEDATPSINGVYLYKTRYMVTTHFGVRGSAVKIWDIPTATQLQSFLLNANLAYNIRFSQNGDTIYSYHTDESVFRFYQKGKRFQLDTLKKPFTPFLYGSIFIDFSKDRKALRQKDESAFTEMLQQPGISCVNADPENKMTICFADSLLPPEDCRLRKLPLDLRINNAFLVAAGLGKETSQWDILDKDMYSNYACSSESLPVFLNRTRSSAIDSLKASCYYRMMKGIEPCPHFIYFSESESTKFMEAYYYKQKPLYVELGGMPQSAIFFFPDSVVVWKSETGLFQSYICNIADMDIYYDYNEDYIAIANSNTSSISVINLRQPKSAATRWIAFGDDDYFVTTSSGFFKTKGRSNRINLFIDNQPLAFSSFDFRYNRPDLVMKEIGAADSTIINAYRAAYFKRLKRNGFKAIDNIKVSQPQADFVNRNAIAYQQKNELFPLQFSGHDSVNTLSSFNVWINGVPLFGIDGQKINESYQSFDTVFQIKLSQGENRIEASVTNIAGIESYRIPLLLNYSTDSSKKVNTHFIGIGIDHFAEKSNNLSWSVKDIRNLVEAFKIKYADRCLIDTLFDSDVTVRNITDLKDKLRHSDINDNVILAYSGHGLLSDSLDYYLSTYPVDFHHPEIAGLPYDKLEDLLDGIPARKKLMLIDACHSGELDKEEGIVLNKSADVLGLSKGIIIDKLSKQQVGLNNSFELMQSLFANVGKSTGATIISAAAGNQFALERGDLKNGVFTFSILELMQQKPHARVSELKHYVNARVSELTKGLQVPTSRTDNVVMDWEVW